MSIKVIRPGLNTTFQDRGRPNLYHLGIPFSGAMDNRSFLIANKLVDNDPNDAVLEFALHGPKLKIKKNEVICVVKGNLNFTFKKNSKIYNGECQKTFDLNNDDEVDIISTNNSMYGYFSISGGFKIEKKWNSFSTHTRSKVGPNQGNKIVEDDDLQLNKNLKPISKKNKASPYVVKKFKPKVLAKKKGKKNVSEAGIPTTILLANKIVLSKFLCSA